MKRWIGPAVAGLLCTAAAWHGTLAAMTFGLMEGAVRRLSVDGGVNAMIHPGLATPARQPIVRPSPDLAYSVCPFDLSAGPLDIRVVPVAGRYSSLSVFDARTDAVFVRNDIQARGQPYRVILAREGQAVPAGVTVVRLDHDRGIALVRLLLADPAEIGALDPVRRQSDCRTLARNSGEKGVASRAPPA